MLSYSAVWLQCSGLVFIDQMIGDNGIIHTSRCIGNKVNIFIFSDFFITDRYLKQILNIILLIGRILFLLCLNCSIFLLICLHGNCCHAASKKCNGQHTCHNTDYIFIFQSGF